MSTNQKPFPARALSFLFKYMSMFKRHIFVSCLLMFMVVVVDNLSSWFFTRIIEAVKGGVSDQAMKTALVFACLVAVCTVLNIFLPRINFLYRQKHVYFPMEAEINKDALAYIQGHSYNYISANHTGLFVNKIAGISGIQSIVSLMMVGCWEIVGQIIIKTTILVIINVWLGVLFLFCVVSSYIFNIVVNKTSERLSKMKNRIESLYSGWLVDVVSNMRFVKQFNRVKFEKDRLFSLLRQNYRMERKSTGESLRTYTYCGVFINLCSMLMIILAVYLWSMGKIGVGDIVFVLLTITSGLDYLIYLHERVRNIRNLLSEVQEALKPFIIAHEIVDVPKAKRLKISNGEVEFRNVSFSYNKNKKVFDDFSLKIVAKEKIGIVGISGSGKTTLVNLLQRAYEPLAGKVFIDGKDIAKVTQDSLHEGISLIPQETTLFHRTIKENILFGNPKAKEDEIIDAGKRAYADEFIACLPNGYETQVGDRGCKLSGGEKQRIAIARAILKDSPILILDEATSSLDSESEYLISSAISEIIKGKTVIAIAHRLSTLKEMDRIIVLENGKIVEEGSYLELSKKKGGRFNHFRKLQRSKEGGEDEKADS